MASGWQNPPAVAGSVFLWLSVTSLKTYVWSFSMLWGQEKWKPAPWKKLSWCVMACIYTHDETGTWHKCSPSFLPLPPPCSMASWTLCFPSFLFSSQIPKFCHIGSKQSFPLCPGQFVKKAGNRRSLATVQPLVQLANSCGPCFQSKRGSFCILANRCWDMLRHGAASTRQLTV